MNVQVVESVLKLNDDVAAANRRVLQEAGIFSIDLIGGPGCGKTLLIERTVAALRKVMKIGVIVGDLTTARDAERIAAFCPNVVQINTGKGCHLEAHQVRQGLERASVALLVSTALLEPAIGLVNTYQWYPWPFPFRQTHFALAWVIVGSIALHVAVKLPIIVRSWSRRSAADDRSVTDD